MSGIIGHSMYAVLGAQATAQRGSPVPPIIARHFTSYLAGAYLGSDIQTMPEAICVDTGLRHSAAGQESPHRRPRAPVEAQTPRR